MLKMGKKGNKKAKMPKAKSLTPPDSGPQRPDIKAELASLGLSLGPLKLIAKSPFSHVVNPSDTVSLISRDNVEFLVSQSLLSFASPYFKNILDSLDVPADEEKEKHKSEPNSALEWEVIGSDTVVDVDESSIVLDALLRFIYPIPSPTFKEPGDEDLVHELPFKFMGSIYDAAQRFQLPYVSERILAIANEMIHIKSIPESGTAALKTYGVACRLNLDNDTKLRAARNALCIPVSISSLTGEGVSSADIERFAKFQKHSIQACESLLCINPEDAYPTGLSDVYASFIACAHCCGVSPTGNVMRCGAAGWWQLYASSALENLRRAPLDPTIFFEKFLTPVFREAQKCHACASVVHWKWCNMMPMLAQTIPAKVYEVRVS